MEDRIAVITAQCDALAQEFSLALAQREAALMTQFSQQVEKRLQGLKKERQRLQHTLNQLPFYKLQEKRSTQDSIQRIDACIAEYSGSAAQQARMEYARRVQHATEQYRSRLDGYLSHRFPGEALRRQAQAEFDGWYATSHSRLKDIIYAQLQKTPGMTQEQIAASHPLLQERSARRISHLLLGLLEKGQITVSDGANPTYRTAGVRVPKQPRLPDIPADYEDPQAAQQPIPLPPSVEDVL